MTEAETLELVVMYTEAGMTAYSIYLTITFAYMSVAYLIGSKLSRFQVAAASGLYLLGSLSALISAYMHVHAWSALKSEFPSGLTTLEGSMWWNGPYWKVLVAASLSFGILVSLYFMYNVRQTAGRK